MKIAFTRKNKNIFSTMVQKLTRSRWSHTFIIEGDFILESAFGKGFRIGLLTEYTENPNVEIEVFEVADKLDLNTIKPLIPRHYGYLQSIGFLFMKWFNLEKNPSTQGLWCSEVSLIILLSTKFRGLFSHLLMDSTAPEDIYQIIKANADTLKV